MSLQVNDRVYATIVENGYWKACIKGKIVGETAKFWIVASGTHLFWNTEKCVQENRRFLKAAGRLEKREVTNAA